MNKSEQIFAKHWTKQTGKPLDEATKKHMQYAIDAIDEALEVQENETKCQYKTHHWAISKTDINSFNNELQQYTSNGYIVIGSISTASFIDVYENLSTTYTVMLSKTTLINQNPKPNE